jgi:hypothetical protein
MHRGRPKQDLVVSAEDLVTLHRWTSRPQDCEGAGDALSDHS